MESTEKLIDQLPAETVEELESIPGTPVFFFGLYYNQHGFIFESLETKEVREDPEVNKNRERIFQDVGSAVTGTLKTTISAAAGRSLLLSARLTKNPNDLRTIAYFPCFIIPDKKGGSNWHMPVIKSTACQLHSVNQAIDPVHTAIAQELGKL